MRRGFPAATRPEAAKAFLDRVLGVLPRATSSRILFAYVKPPRGHIAHWRLKHGMEEHEQWALAESIKAAMVAANLANFEGQDLWVSRAKSAQALARLAKTREAHSAIKKLAETTRTILATASCGRAGKVWLQGSQETIATLDRQRGEMVWSEPVLRRLGTTVEKALEACAEVRRERQFL